MRALALLTVLWAVGVPLQAPAGGLPASGAPEPVADRPAGDAAEAAADRPAGGAPEPAATPERPAGGTPAVPTRDAVDPAARLPAGDDAAEHWDLAARFDSGHRLYARFLITNTGPGERSAAAFGHWVEPDGQAHEFRNGRLAGRWQLLDDGRRIQVGSSGLSFQEGRRHFEVDNDKRGIKLRLDFPADASARSGPADASGYRIDLLNLATPARGSVWLRGMAAPRPLEGRVLLTHTWFPGPEVRHVLRRLDVASLGPGPRLFLSDVTPPQGAPWRWLVAGDPDRVQSVDGIALTAGDTRGGDYPVPRTLELRGNTLSGVITLGNPGLEIDPLDALPALVRMVYSFGRRPRHLWVDSTADVVLKSSPRDAVLRIRGAAIATLFFLDALPQSQH